VNKKKTESANTESADKAADSGDLALVTETAGNETAPDPRESLNSETGVLAWSELVRYFARGVVIKVGAELDLVEVGHCVSSDDSATMQSWLDAALIARASDDDARDWNKFCAKAVDAVFKLFVWQ